MKTLVLILTLATMAPMVHAEEAAKPAECTPSDDNLPAAWSMWKSPGVLLSATDAAKAPDVAPGHAYKLTLSPVAQVIYPVAAKKPPMADTFGGLLSLKVATAGVYSIALDGKAWIDVTKDGALVWSVAHDHGPTCTTVSKAVDFKLDPGLYSIQIANSPGADLKLAIVQK